MRRTPGILVGSVAVLALLGGAAAIQADKGDGDVVAAQAATTQPEASLATPGPPPTAEQLRRAEFLNAAQHLGDGFEVPEKPPYRIALTPGSDAADGLPEGYRAEVVREIVERASPYSRLEENTTLRAMCAPRVEEGVTFSSCVETFADLGPETGPDGRPTRSGPIVQVQHLVGAGERSLFGLRVFLVQPRNLKDARIVTYTLWASGDAAGTTAQGDAARAWVDAFTERMVAAVVGQPAATWSASEG